MNTSSKRSSAVFGVCAAVTAAALGLASAAEATTVLWYGKNCADETGAALKGGALVQLIRSPDGTIGRPDPVTGAPTGNDAVCAVTKYECAGSTGCYFQGDDWNEKENYYVCVRVWNAGDAASGTSYWDSAVYPAAGMLPVDINCLGARADKRK